MVFVKVVFYKMIFVRISKWSSSKFSSSKLSSSKVVFVKVQSGLRRMGLRQNSLHRMDLRRNSLCWMVFIGILFVELIVVEMVFGLLVSPYRKLSYICQWLRQSFTDFYLAFGTAQLQLTYGIGWPLIIRPTFCSLPIATAFIKDHIATLCITGILLHSFEKPKAKKSCRV